MDNGLTGTPILLSSRNYLSKVVFSSMLFHMRCNLGITELEDRLELVEELLVAVNAATF